MKMILFKTALLLALLVCVAERGMAVGTNEYLCFLPNGPAQSPPTNPDGSLGLLSPPPGSGFPGAGGMTIIPGSLVMWEWGVMASGGPNPDSEDLKYGWYVYALIGLDPVRFIDGSTVLSETDIVIPCPLIDLVFMRQYDSNLTGGDNMGFRWVHSYEWAIVKYKEPGGEFGDWLSLRAYCDPNQGPYQGGSHWFKKGTNGLYTVSGAAPYVMTVDDAGEYDVRMPGGLMYHFNTNGVLQNIVHPAGQRVDLTYATGKLTRVEHSNGKFLQFEYNAASQISRITTPSTNLSVSFTYDVGTSGGSLSTTRPLLLKTTRHTPRGDFDLTYGYGEAVQ